jgi:hypothetical protein
MGGSGGADLFVDVEADGVFGAFRVGPESGRRHGQAATERSSSLSADVGVGE